MTLALFLDSHPKIAKVNYPGLPSHPGHLLSASQSCASPPLFGGMLSFELLRPAAPPVPDALLRARVLALLGSLRVFTQATS
eukprot:CAMPEP_0184728818 /NCGR_PEP_ID=MMETSP0314-20130426/41928_1 /TAXON_ID=38298 /ORGANISM="Rhodella maculata, Strain CCMP 736" /LENGTH=81 /DNA_ID=CAMNT_0027194731 /DNA_START=32 /DNA_END=274 /DNA_ORIENTATION=-